MLDVLFCFVCVKEESEVSVQMSSREESNGKNAGANPQGNGIAEQQQCGPEHN